MKLTLSVCLLSLAVFRSALGEDVEPILSRKPYIQMTTPNSAVIVWRTLGKSAPRLRYGETLARLNQSVDSSKIVVRVMPPPELPPDPDLGGDGDVALEEEVPKNRGKGPFGLDQPQQPNPSGEDLPELEGEVPPDVEVEGELPDDLPPIPIPDEVPVPPQVEKKPTSGRGVFGGQGKQPDQPPEDEYAKYPHLHSADPDTWQYEAMITGLKPDKKYYYSVGHEDLILAGATEEHYFHTSPSSTETRPLRFWFVGDSGTGADSQKQAFQAMRNFVAADKRRVDAYIHLGDMAYGSGEDYQFGAYFFDIYDPLLKNTVCWPTQGNHEGYTSAGSLQLGPYYDAYVTPTKGEAGGAPSGTEAYYSFDWGPVHFVCLNSYDISRSSTGEMALWLQADLARTKAKWLIGFWHHPPYTKGTHDSDREIELVEMRNTFMPILESAGVDFVLCGHSHVYERSMLIDGAYQTPTVAEGVVLDDGDGNPSGDGAYLKSANLNPHQGTVAVVSGHGYSAANFYGTMPVMRQVWVEAGSFILDIDGDTATGTMLNQLGQVRDRFQLIKRGKVTPTRVRDPWRAETPRISTAQLGPGKLQISLSPVPTAPDAKIHYTLDGSEPTTSSPLYQGPFALDQLARLKAVSFWRENQRRSLTLETLLFVDRRHLIRVPVQYSEDDATDLLGKSDSKGLELGLVKEGSQTLGLRFRNLGIPQGVLITRAYLQFTSSKVSATEHSMLLQGEASPDTLPYTNDPVAGRKRTVMAVQWTVPPWLFAGARSDPQRSPDLSSIVQEIVSMPSWKVGNSMGFLLSGSGTSSVVSVDGNPSDAAELVVLYEPRSPLEANVAQPPIITLAKDRNLSQVLQLSFRRLKAAQTYGLSYSLETSVDLKSPTWQPLTVPNEAVLVSPSEGVWEQVLLRISGLPLDNSQRFIRLRVTQRVP